jgi:hypothetical protein
MKTEIFATTIIMVGIVLTGFQVVYAQVLDRDVEAPTPGLNGTAPPNVIFHHWNHFLLTAPLL